MFYVYCASTVRSTRQVFTFVRHKVVLSDAENTATVSELCYLVIFLVTLKKENPSYIKSPLCLSAPFIVADI